MKKKNLVLLGSAAMLSLALAGSVGAFVTASATDLTSSGEDTGSTTVTYTVADSWTVTIPETITVGSEGEDVVAKDVVIEQGKKLKVSVSSENSWQVQDESGENGFIYQLKAGEEVITNEVLSVDAGTTGETKKNLKAELNDPDKVGKYSTGGVAYDDTLTFSVEVTE